MPSGDSPKKTRKGGCSASTTLRNGSTSGLWVATTLLAPRLLSRSTDVSVGRILLAVLRRWASPIGRESTWLNQRHMNAEAGNLLREGLREAFKRPLGCVIGPDAWERGDTANARNLNDVAGALRPQDWERSLRDP